MKAVCVEFIPERTKLPDGKTYTRALVDSDELECIELPADAEDTTPDEGEGGGENDNPLG